MRMGFSKRKHRGFILAVILIFIFFWIIAVRLQPTFVSVARETANNFVVDIIHRDIEEVLQDFKTDDFYVFEDKMLTANTAAVNKFKAQLINKLNKSLSENNLIVKVPLGGISKIYILNGLGPNIPIKISPHKKINASLDNSFESAGINFVKHTMYLKISVDVSCRGFLMNESEAVTTDIPIIENILSGEIPEYYGGGLGITKN